MDHELLLYYPLLDPIMKDPDEVLEIYGRHGCHMIEISLPCPHPNLDGMVIRDSMKRILERYTVRDVFLAIRGVKERFPYIKVQLMSYLETVEEIGFGAFADLCGNALVDYVLFPDASDSQLAKLDQAFAQRYDIPVIRFLPYTDSQTMVRRALTGKGYLFLQSGDAKSGGSQEIGEELRQRIACLRRHGIETPVVVGFGIKRREQIQACFQCGANGAAIGSGLLDTIAKSETEHYLASLSVE